jgi:hypothetical protein
MWAERGRSIMAYLVAGIILGLAVGIIAYGIGVLIKVVASAYDVMHTTAMNKTAGIEPEKVAVKVGNETATLPMPENPGLRASAELIIKILTVLSAILTNPLTLAVIIALTLVTYALIERP